MRATALPPVLVLTDRARARGRPLTDVVRGAPAVVLREKDLPAAARRALAGDVGSVVDLLVVASDPTIDADGVHLSSADPFPASPGARPALVGRSCHDRSSLEWAAAEGCDYATLSPIFPSSSKPGYGPPLGVDALRGAPLPVYALGGIDASNARRCREAGAAGVAVMGAVMRADDPARVIEELLP